MSLSRESLKQCVKAKDDDQHEWLMRFVLSIKTTTTMTTKWEKRKVSQTVTEETNDDSSTNACMICDKWWHNVWRWKESERAMIPNWLHLCLWQFQVGSVETFSSPKRALARETERTNERTKAPKQFVAFNYDGEHLALNKFLCMWQFSNV